MPHVVFASELYADRRADPFRQQCRLGAEVRFRLAPKTATEKGDVYAHLLRRRAEHARDFRLCSLRVLRGSPHLATVAADVRVRPQSRPAASCGCPGPSPNDG